MQFYILSFSVKANVCVCSYIFSLVPLPSLILLLCSFIPSVLFILIICLFFHPFPASSSLAASLLLSQPATSQPHTILLSCALSIPDQTLCRCVVDVIQQQRHYLHLPSAKQERQRGGGGSDAMYQEARGRK